MKIFILKVPDILQPEKQAIKYPAHNKDYGVEQDFLIWLNKHPELISTDPKSADWHYLPVYWTRWLINHGFGTNNDDLAYLQRSIDSIIIDDKKTFTISQFDGGTLVNTGATVVFTAARTTNPGIDIPILCSPHKVPPIRPAKKYLATFNGSFNTHPLRIEMQQKLAANPEVLIGGGLPTRFIKRWLWAKNFNLKTMEAYIALCPRGTSCSSFRFFEAMQMGVAPCLIGDVDARPFKKFIPWDKISYWVPAVDDLTRLLSDLDKKEAIAKGKLAYRYWKNDLRYQKWCKYVLMELEQ